ncbi:MAG: nucleotide triphosphate diphosphatase NUDT15 [Candidatus Paceibacterota bacterium]
MLEEKPKVAVNIFVVRNNKILLGKRKNITGHGTWGLPGGHLEFMESLEESAARELEEETGLKAEKLVFHDLINEPRDEDNSHYLHVNFVAHNVSGEPRVCEPDKCFEWQWFDIDDLPENIFIGHRLCIPAYVDNVVFNDHSRE